MLTPAIATLLLLGQTAASAAQIQSPSNPPSGPFIAQPSPPAAPPTLARRARPINPGSWILETDYPVGAAAGNQAGTVGFRVTVSETGLPTACTVTTSSGWPLLDEYTCRLISERARFTAALDERGRPTAGTFSSRIQWRLPPPEPAPTPAPTPAPPPPR
jgi:periplasmic protein TonB